MEVALAFNLTPSVQQYSDNNDLSVFLRTLSYHSLGAHVITNTLVRHFSRSQSWSCADIGCGNGFFTRRFTMGLSRQGLIPSCIYGLDPDTDNLRDYLGALRDFPNRLVLERGVVQSLQAPASDVVLCSHSLYQALEDPTSSEGQKDDLISRLIQCVKANGLLVISLASSRSVAYGLKTLLQEKLGKKEPSVFGENLAIRLTRMGISYEIETHESYADLSDVLDDHYALAAWLRYFCRLGRDEVDADRVGHLTRDVRSFVARFGDMQPEIRSTYATYPADKRLCNDSVLLPHAECFLVVENGS